jgi:NAD(P)-dependent dehydrogenase (short-subunit alcohol dehydrogenase family)
MNEAGLRPSLAGRLVSRVALVTGGTRGIGEAIVRLFAAEGASVAFCGRRRSLGEALQQELIASDYQALFMEADVSREEDVRRLVAHTLERFGRLDIVVNNAGITASGPVEHLSVETWRSVMEHNVTSMFLVSREAIPALRKAGGGSIVNLGSTYGTVGSAGNSAYGVSKAAAINFSRHLALELAPDHIRVNALCPGAVATPMNREWANAQDDPEDALRKLAEKHPIGRISSPEEQARAALFLASDESSYMTGSALMSDGGYTAA